MTNPNTETADEPEFHVWLHKAMEQINNLTPDIKNKSVDVGWFLLRNHLEDGARTLIRNATKGQAADHDCIVAALQSRIDAKEAQNIGLLKELSALVIDYGALRTQLAQAQNEALELRKIAAHVPGMAYIKAKEAAGFGVEVKPSSPKSAEGEPG